MTQYNFDVNIEKRMPTTGKVFFVDRMTCDYAVAHPFNVDEFIESVWQKHQGTESRETIRQYFDYGLGRKGEKYSTHCPAKFPDKITKDGDLILGQFPKYVGGCRPALIEAWNKGAEYHTKGLRQGDLLPAILPPCKITRTEGGWIALFPKDTHLLSETATKADTREEEQSLEVPCQAEISQIETNLEEVSQSENLTEEDLKDSEGFLGETDSKRQERQEPVQLDLFAQMQQEIAQLRQEQQRLQAQLTLERRHREQTAAAQVQTAEPVPAEEPSAPRPRRVRRPQQSRQWSEAKDVCRRPSRSARPSIPQSVAATAPTKREYPAWAKGLACMVAASVALVVIYNTGLLIPLGLIGLASSGLIK